MKTLTARSPPDTLHRVFRGGAWDSYDDAWVRAAFRGRFAPADRSDDIGFRCALRGVRMNINDKEVTP